MLLSFSGGQDSVCFVFILNQLYYQLELDITFFWCHHMWQTDSFYLMQQIAKLSFLFQFNSCFPIPLSCISSELLARKWRQSCSYRVSLFYNYSKICLAHTFNDKIENIFLNFIRGTGLIGLTPLRWIQLAKRISKPNIILNNFLNTAHTLYTPFFCIPPTRKLSSEAHTYTPIQIEDLASVYPFGVRGVKLAPRQRFVWSHALQVANPFGVCPHISLTQKLRFSFPDKSSDKSGSEAYPFGVKDLRFSSNPPYPKGVNVTLNEDLSGVCVESLNPPYPKGVTLNKDLSKNEKRSYCVNEMCEQTPKGLATCKGLRLEDLAYVWGYPKGVNYEEYALVTNRRFSIPQRGKRVGNVMCGLNKPLNKEWDKQLLDGCYIVRPLLSISRIELNKICYFWELPIYPDKSNQKVKFLRNRVRGQLLPTIKLFFNLNIENIFLQLAKIVETEDYCLTQIVNEFIKNTDAYHTKLDIYSKRKR